MQNHIQMYTTCVWNKLKKSSKFPALPSNLPLNHHLHTRICWIFHERLVGQCKTWEDLTNTNPRSHSTLPNHPIFLHEMLGKETLTSGCGTAKTSLVDQSPIKYSNCGFCLGANSNPTSNSCGWFRPMQVLKFPLTQQEVERRMQFVGAVPNYA